MNKFYLDRVAPRTKIITPSSFFLFNSIFILFFIIPSAIFSFGLYTGNELFSRWAINPSSSASFLSLKLSFFFVFIFNSTYLVLSHCKVFLFIRTREGAESLCDLTSPKYQNSLLKLIYIYGACAVLVYFFSTGYQKLSLLGSGLTAWDYRMMGFDDTPVYLKVLLETSRRVLLPFLLILEIYRLRLSGKKIFKFGNIYLFSLIIFFVLSIVSTFDRGPLLVFLMTFIYSSVFINPKFIRSIRVAVLGLIGVAIMASITTYLQYNITEFSVVQIAYSGFHFILQRVFLDPSLTAIQLGYEVFPPGSDFLNFKYSRLGVLLGGEYIGTESDNSIFVTPVGAIADSWRNLGYIGVILTSFINSLIAVKTDRYIKKDSNALFSFSISFMYFSFIFFQVFGVFYSMGAFFQIAFLVFSFLFFRKKKNYRFNL